MTIKYKLLVSNVLPDLFVVHKDGHKFVMDQNEDGSWSMDVWVHWDRINGCDARNLTEIMLGNEIFVDRQLDPDEPEIYPVWFTAKHPSALMWLMRQEEFDANWERYAGTEYDDGWDSIYDGPEYDN